MSGIFRLAFNDLRLTVRDRAAFFWLLVFPLFMMWIFGQMGAGTAGPKAISLTVIDEDGGWLARAFVHELRDETVQFEELTRDEYDAAPERIRCLAIPEGFTSGALDGRRQVLRFESRPGADPEFSMAGRVHAVRAIARTLGRLTELDPDVAGDPARASAAFAALASRTPAVTLQVSTAGRGRPVPAGYAQSVPGTLTMIVLMMTLIYGAVFLTIEKRAGMLRRQISLPLSRTQIYLGKVAGRVLIAGLQIVVLLVAGRFLFGVSWGESVVGLVLVLVSYALAVAGLATLLGAWVRTPAQASAVGWLASMILAGLGGCWWPIEMMPGWMRTVAHALPTTWAMEAFHSLISFGNGASAVMLPCAMLLGFAALFSALGARYLRFD